jgi:hypothetical protein
MCLSQKNKLPNRLVVLFAATLLLHSCSETSPDDLVEIVPITQVVTYDADVSPIVQSQCLSCHNDSYAAGNNSYSSYEQFKDATINGNVIDRITRNLGDPLAMPQGGRLPQSSIDLILRWEIDGLLQN